MKVTELSEIAPTAQPQSPESYSLWLDAMRWPAALTVVIAHAGQVYLSSVDGRPLKGWALIHYAYSFVAGLSHAAVMIFFVLSGYLVGGSVVRADLQRNFDPANYMLRRLSRLWVVLLPALGLTLLLKLSAAWMFPNIAMLVYAGDPTVDLTSGDFLCNAAFLQQVACARYGGNIALWSLANEFWYYVLFPGVYALIRRPAHPGSWVYTIFVTALLVICSFCSKTPASMAPYFLIWCLGVMAYIAPINPTLDAKICAALFISVLVSVRLIGGKELVGAANWLTFIFDLIIASAFSVMLVALKSEARLRAPVLVRTNTVLANFSYSLYCTHMPLLFFSSTLLFAGFGNGWHMVRDTPDTWLFTAAGLGLTIAGSWVFSLATEANTDRIRRFFERRLIGKAGPNDRERMIADNPSGPP